MFKINVFLLASAVFALCESAAFVAKLKKCTVKDNQCQQDIYKTIIQEVVDNGIPELEVPKLDPFVIKDVSLNALGMVTITAVDGVAKGLKDCYLTSFNSDVEKFRTTVGIECDTFSVEGDYKIESTPTLLALIGGINVHGQGKGAVVLEKMHVELDFSYEIQKLDDGEYHLVLKPEETISNLEVKGKATFSADNAYIGNQEISTVAVNILNENWQFISKTLGKTVIDKALEIFYPLAQKLFSTIPLKDFFTDDISAYAKN